MEQAFSSCGPWTCGLASSAENKFSMQILSGEPGEGGGPAIWVCQALQGILMQAQVGKSLTWRKLLLREEGGEGAESRQTRGRARVSEPGGEGLRPDPWAPVLGFAMRQLPTLGQPQHLPVPSSFTQRDAHRPAASSNPAQPSSQRGGVPGHGFKLRPQWASLMVRSAMQDTREMRV